MAIIDTSFKDLPDKVAVALESLALSETMLRCSMDWGGQTSIPCTGTPEEDRDILAAGGFVQVRQVKILVRTVKFQTGGGYPQKQHTLTYYPAENADGVVYRIVAVKNHWNAWFELRCETAHRGA